MPVVLLPSLERGQTVLALSQAVVPLGEMGLERAALAELRVAHGAPELAAFVRELVLAQPALAHEALATHLAHKGHRGAVELFLPRRCLSRSRICVWAPPPFPPSFQKCFRHCQSGH